MKMRRINLQRREGKSNVLQTYSSRFHFAIMKRVRHKCCKFVPIDVSAALHITRDEFATFVTQPFHYRKMKTRRIHLQELEAKSSPVQFRFHRQTVKTERNIRRTRGKYFSGPPPWLFFSPKNFRSVQCHRLLGEIPSGSSRAFPWTASCRPTSVLFFIPFHDNETWKYPFSYLGGDPYPPFFHMK